MLTLFRIALITGLWTASLLMLVACTMLNENPDLAVLSSWALFVALLAALATAWHIGACLLKHDRGRLRFMARQAADACVEKQQQELRSVE